MDCSQSAKEGLLKLSHGENEKSVSIGIDTNGSELPVDVALYLRSKDLGTCDLPTMEVEARRRSLLCSEAAHPTYRFAKKTRVKQCERVWMGDKR